METYLARHEVAPVAGDQGMDDAVGLPPEMEHHDLVLHEVNLERWNVAGKSICERRQLLEVVKMDVPRIGRELLGGLVDAVPVNPLWLDERVRSTHTQLRLGVLIDFCDVGDVLDTEAVEVGVDEVLVDRFGRRTFPTAFSHVFQVDVRVQSERERREVFQRYRLLRWGRGGLR